MISHSCTDSSSNVTVRLYPFTDDLSKPFYAVGPLLPPDYGSDAASLHGESNIETRAFLDRVCVKYGERSTLYVRSPLFLPGCRVLTRSIQMSFGTIFWPTIQEYVDEVIEALLEKEFPFVRLSTVYSGSDSNMPSIRFSAMHHLLQKSLKTCLRESRTRALACSPHGLRNRPS